MAAQENIIYCFAEFELEPAERRLRCAGKPVALTPKVFDTLVLLVRNAGHVSRKDDLMRTLWPRGYVDEATLSNHVWQIRRALGDTAKATRFIETVPKLGYRFAAEVQTRPSFPVPRVAPSVAPPAPTGPTASAAGAAAAPIPEVAQAPADASSGKPAPAELPGPGPESPSLPVGRRPWWSGAALAVAAVAVGATIMIVRHPRPLPAAPAPASAPAPAPAAPPVSHSALDTAPDATLRQAFSQAPPPTPEVGRRIGRALGALDRYDAAQARDELLEAVAQAPGYAPAYLYLAKAWDALGNREKSLAAAEQAALHAGALPEEQRRLVDATVQTARYEWQAAATSWSALVLLKPAAIDYRIACADALLAAGDPVRATSVVENLKQLAEAANDPRATLVAARVADARSDAQGSATLALQALRQAQARDLPMTIAEAEVQLGAERARLGDNAGAQVELEAAIAAYRRLGNPRGEAQARRTLASVLSDAQAAREEYQRAMALSQSIGDQAGVAAVYRNLCSLLWAAGDRDAAEVAARHALKIGRNTGDLRMQAWTLRALATIAADDAATDEVVAQYREVMTLTERSHDFGGHVWSLATNADTLRLRGALREADEECARALTEAAALTDPQFRVYSSFTCASVALDRGETAAAHALLQQTARWSASSDNAVYSANTEFLLGQIDIDAGHFVDARGHLEAAARRYAGVQAATGEANAHALLALCAQRLGDRSARAAAVARATQLRAGITSKQEVYIVDLSLAQLASSPLERSDAIAQLQELAADAERRHWLSWSLEARLAEWRLLKIDGAAAANRLRQELEATARQHGFGRILALLN